MEFAPQSCEANHEQLFRSDLPSALCKVAENPHECDLRSALFEEKPSP